MDFSIDVYYGYIVRGDLKGAMSYLQQFPEQEKRYRRFLSVFEQENYIDYNVDAELNEILRAYQRYYRDVFYLGIDREAV